MGRIAVAGLWDLSWSVPMMEMSYWEGLVREFDVERFYMSPITGISHKLVQERPDLDSVFGELEEDFQVVMLSEEGATFLEDFEHPENALYVFGKGNYSPFNDLAKRKGVSVQVRTPVSKGMMLAPVIASIILYDRYIKELKNGINNR